jgi:hypothetical protein
MPRTINLSTEIEQISMDDGLDLNIAGPALVQLCKGLINVTFVVVRKGDNIDVTITEAKNEVTPQEEPS